MAAGFCHCCIILLLEPRDRGLPQEVVETSSLNPESNLDPLTYTPIILLVLLPYGHFIVQAKNFIYIESVSKLYSKKLQYLLLRRTCDNDSGKTAYLCFIKRSAL